MATRKIAVLDQALRLPAKERAEVAGELIKSLDGEELDEDPGDIEAAWAEEILRRDRELAEGRVKGLTRAEARAIVAADPKPRR